MTYKTREQKNEAQRRYRANHPEVVEKENARKHYKPVLQRYCSNCKEPMDNRRWKIGVCKSCEKAAKKYPIACGKCGTVFIGDGRTKYCGECGKKTLPSVLEAIRNFVQRNRAKERGLVADLTSKDWRKTLSHFDYRCAYCGAGGRLHQDHFIPVALGGGYTKKNIVPACPPCNYKKSDRHPADFLPREKYRQIADYLGV